jgi:Icc-related predicted phosphoesterase
MKKITFISDTHQKHGLLTNDLIGGDILIHAGDIMTSGYYETEVKNFCEWFSKLNNYKHKIFIAGNHDRLAEDNPNLFKRIVDEYPNITYLQDSEVIIDGVKIYGSPWQPEFYNWGFNLPRRGPGLISKCQEIPEDTDILITHGPPNGILDYVAQSVKHAGCEELLERVMQVKPKVNVFGHIHQGYGTLRVNEIEFINASVLNESYNYANLPINVEYDEVMGIVKYY